MIEIKIMYYIYVVAGFSMDLKHAQNNEQQRNNLKKTILISPMPFELYLYEM